MGKWLLFSVVLLQLITVNAQDKESSTSDFQGKIITRFQTFFDAEIRRQGVKGNWIFRLNEITGTHKFDFDNDGFMDTLLEFNAVPVEGGGIVNHYAVLFRNLDNTDLKALDYITTDGLLFEGYEAPYFKFIKGLDRNSELRQLFVWQDRKFLKVVK